MMFEINWKEICLSIFGLIRYGWIFIPIHIELRLPTEDTTSERGGVYQYFHEMLKIHFLLEKLVIQNKKRIVRMKLFVNCWLVIVSNEFM